MRQLARSPHGLTLIETIVVITILSLIMAAVAVYAVGQLGHAKRKVTKIDIHSTVEAVELFRANRGRYPSTDEGIQALLAEKVLKRAPKDAWGNPLTYALEENEPVVTSFGADGKAGGEGDDADLSSRDLE
jgi:general secretion pathway protein G